MRLLSIILFITAFQLVSGFEFTKNDVIENREFAREMFYHGQKRDDSTSRGDMDDVLGNYSLTLLDTLDTLVVLGDYEEFERVSYLYFNTVSFDKDITINLFEVNIRALGGLISAHFLATQLQSESKLLLQREKQDINEFNGEQDQDQNTFGILGEYQINLINELQQFFQNETFNYLYTKDHQRLINQLERTKTQGYFVNYNNQYLSLAIDLGLRLLPAFQTKTGIPYSRVNLRNGVRENEDTETCLAGAGTLLLEFGALSRLSGYSVFESVAKKAMQQLVSRKSKINLLASMIDVQSGTWLDNYATIGAGGDSFYEYLFKSYLLFGDKEFLDSYSLIYKAIVNYNRKDHYYFSTDYRTGSINKNSIDSLSAFWPGLQVLSGDIANAVECHLRFYVIISMFGLLPEVYYPTQKQYNRYNDDYHLRPEFIESSYYLYEATQHPFYRFVNSRLLKVINNTTRVDCGFASVGIFDLSLDDRMDSFFLSETLKYMYLLFDDSHWISKGNYLFTTEGHIFDINDIHARKPSHLSQDTCDVVPDEVYARLDSVLQSITVSKNVKLNESAETVPNTPKPITTIDTVATIVGEHVVINVLPLPQDDQPILGSFALFGPKFPKKEGAVAYEFAFASPLDACASLIEDYQNKIVIAIRGSCPFSEKVENIQNANGIGAIIYNNDENNEAHLQITMTGNENDDTIRIPSCFISYVDGEYLKEFSDSGFNVELEIHHTDEPLVYLDFNDLKGISEAQYAKVVKEVEALLKTVKLSGHVSQFSLQLQINNEDYDEESS